MKYIKLCLIFIILLFISNNKVQAENSTGYIIIGDSRTVGMSKAVKNEPNVFFVAKCSEGYNWFCEEAIDEVADIISGNNYSNWKVVSYLGVNDLGNVDKYKQKYKDLLQTDWKDYDFYVVSVTYIDNAKYNGSVTNNKIQEFNKQMSYYKNYIDLYNFSVDNVQTSDGLHYDEKTYRLLYNRIMDKLK